MFINRILFFFLHILPQSFFQQGNLSKHVETFHPIKTLNIMPLSPQKENDKETDFPIQERDNSQIAESSPMLDINPEIKTNEGDYNDDGKLETEITSQHNDPVDDEKELEFQFDENVGFKESSLSPCERSPFTSERTSDDGKRKRQIPSLRKNTVDNRKELGFQLDENVGFKESSISPCDNIVEKPSNQKRKPFLCTLCDKSFVAHKHMTRHVNDVHHKKKQFTCTFCDKSFTQKGNLKIHEDSVHHKLKAFSCTLCEKSFSAKRSLVAHNDEIHKKLRNFSCSLCDSWYHLKSDLKRHVATVHK